MESHVGPDNYPEKTKNEYVPMQSETSTNPDREHATKLL